MGSAASSIAVDQGRQREQGTDPPDNVVGEDRRRVVEGMLRVVRLRLIGCLNTGDPGGGAHQWPVAHPGAPRPSVPECTTPGEHDPGVEGVQYIVGKPK